MGWFNFKKEKSLEEKAIDLLKQKVFPGGEPERITRAKMVSEICAHKLDFNEAVYVYSKIKVTFEIAISLFDGVTKKGINAEQLVQDAIKDSQGKLNYMEAVAVVSYALFGRAESSLVNINALKTYLAGAFGSDDQGYDADVLPFAIGEFGLEPTNPIPVRGIGGSHIYLGKLRLANDQPVISKRIRALKVADGNIMVDEYEIFDSHNRSVCKLYICPYHQRVSRKAPRGFTVQDMPLSGVPGVPPTLSHYDDAIVQFNLGVRHYNGDGVIKNFVEAAKYFRKAADQGNVNAQCSLGVCYDYGEGVAKDHAEAAKWFRKAAEQGDAIAQRNLGLCYYNGKGVALDFTEAAKWNCKAANQGLPDAENDFAICCYTGNGVSKDLVEAAKWLILASAQGHAPAKRNLSEIEQKMTQEQIAEAQRLAREFKPHEESASGNPI